MEKKMKYALALKFYQMNSKFWFNGKILKVLQMSSGYQLVVLYLQLLCISIKYNGYIPWCNEYETIIEQLEEELYPLGGNFKKLDIETGIKLFMDLKLVKIVEIESYNTKNDNCKNMSLHFTQFECLTSSENLKQLSDSPSAVRQRNFREKKKLMPSKSANSIRQANFRDKKRIETIEGFKKLHPDIILSEKNIKYIASQLHMISSTLSKLWDANLIKERRIKNG